MVHTDSDYDDTEEIWYHIYVLSKQLRILCQLDNDHIFAIFLKCHKFGVY